MPFADPEKSREYHRERRRAQRRQVIDQRVEQNFCQPLPATPLPAAFRLMRNDGRRFRTREAWDNWLMPGALRDAEWAG